MVLQPWHWLVFGVALIVLEMFVPTFFLLWFGTAAVLVALVHWLLPIATITAVVLWLVLSVILCFLWFKFIQPLIKNRTKAGLGAGVIVGEVGMITKPPMAGLPGSVRFNTPMAGASEWACRSQDDTHLMIGDRVVVLNIIGNELLVAKKT